MKRPAVVVILFLLFSLPCQAQVDSDNLLSLDLSYAITGLLNQGGGIGLSYEKKLVNFLSFSGVFGHMIFLTGIKDVYCASVSLSLFTNYYPLSNGLDKLYISAGIGSDFMNYFGSGQQPETPEDTLIHLTPKLGWKFNITRYFMVDLSAGYKFLILDAENYKEIRDYVNPGLRFGLNLKFFLNKLRKEKRNDRSD